MAYIWWQRKCSCTVYIRATEAERVRFSEKKSFTQYIFDHVTPKNNNLSYGPELKYHLKR
jgi:hypothetical protein